VKHLRSKLLQVSLEFHNFGLFEFSHFSSCDWESKSKGEVNLETIESFNGRLELGRDLEQKAS